MNVETIMIQRAIADYEATVRREVAAGARQVPFVDGRGGGMRLRPEELTAIAAYAGKPVTVLPAVGDLKVVADPTAPRKKRHRRSWAFS